MGASERHQNEGHGRRLTMAFEALEAFPALAESRNRLLTVVSQGHLRHSAAGRGRERARGSAEGTASIKARV